MEEERLGGGGRSRAAKTEGVLKRLWKSKGRMRHREVGEEVKLECEGGSGGEATGRRLEEDLQKRQEASSACGGGEGFTP